MDASLSALFESSVRRTRVFRHFLTLDKAGPVQRPQGRHRSQNPVLVAADESLPSALPEDLLPGIPAHESTKKAKRKRKRDEILLEDVYFKKLVEAPQKLKKSSSLGRTMPTDEYAAIPKHQSTALTPIDVRDPALEEAPIKHESEAEPSDTSSDDDDNDEVDEDDESTSDSNSKEPESGAATKDTSFEALVPAHESNGRKDAELEKANATIFVGNLPTSVITSSEDYRALKSLFSPFGKLKSIRFRSIAFSELLPRKVAFVQGKFHPERDTLNAYLVFSRPEEARKALALNGHYFQEKKHIRVDSVAHPAPHNNKKCVFVGSLPFDAEEELLWKHFAVAGEIESVRLIRDKKTNVGKGFAYVQFKESSSVQNSLLLHDKKMPLGEGKGVRKLRITRAQAMPSKHKADQRERDQIKNAGLKPRDKAKLGRVKNLMGSQAAAKLKLMQKEIAMEGERAKAPEGERTRKKRKKSHKDTLRSKSRAAAYRKAESSQARASQS